SYEDKTFENYDPQNPASGALALQNLMLFNNDGWNTGDDTRYAGSYTIEDPGYQDAANFDYRPGNANAANGATPPSDGFFDTGATYYGAFDPSAVTAWIFDGNWVRTSDN
ncbi:MAG: hypothetical protein R3211_11965, partial [Balneolaceae bacterium]|nr:hypothetical protein [Balneolaceae bacterium]